MKPENQIVGYVSSISSLQWVLKDLLSNANVETTITTQRPATVDNPIEYENGFYLCEDYIKKRVESQINFTYHKIKSAINEIASSFALEHTKFSHRFPYVENNYTTKELSTKAKKTYQLLYQNKVNQLVESLPDFIDKTFFTTIYE